MNFKEFLKSHIPNKIIYRLKMGLEILSFAFRVKQIEFYKV